ncbi:hypothetical protein EG328_002784 [Venturia inaequalis]|uniref:non-specific serine/threonine protein kinase n=1 Tax=Venturia inaequalis TaxID=5025 RepID=A0A8H3Z8U1_VENIN|nr:hypothetical protein EG328_002784 [Venturia inaequalis]
MPRKTVYGKRPNKASAFAVSNVFLTSSPTKITRPSTGSKTGHGTIAEATIALQQLQIAEDHENRGSEDHVVSNSAPEEKGDRTRQRRALGARDANSRGPTKSRETIQEHLKSTRDDRKVQEAVEEALPQVTHDKLVLQIESMSPDQPESPKTRAPIPDSSCDPHIVPLISLTNAQTLPILFHDWWTEFAPHLNVSKIAEASYGEVYRLKLLAPIPDLTSTGESVLKVMVVKPDPGTEDKTKKKSMAQEEREERMSEMASVESEVKLLRRMAEVPGFTNFRALHVLKGRPPQPFVDTWKEWNAGRKRGDKSVFPDPSKRPSYSDDTIWAVIEMQDAGTDIDQLQNKGGLTTVFEAWDVFWQVVIAIAKGEVYSEFEHRDLHCGNVCVRNRVSASQDGRDASKRKLGFTNLETTIIDYTLSRAELPRTDHPASLSKSTNSRRSSVDSDDDEKEIAYLDLTNASLEYLFKADATSDYQYEVYRHMRQALYFSDPSKPFKGNEKKALSSGRTWKGFHPQTNAVWLWWILHKLLEHMKKPNKTDVKAQELASVLRKTERMLDVKERKPRPRMNSATELIAVALEHGWLDDTDVYNSF